MRACGIRALQSSCLNVGLVIMAIQHESDQLYSDQRFSEHNPLDRGRTGNHSDKTDIRIYMQVVGQSADLKRIRWERPHQALRLFLLSFGNGIDGVQKPKPTWTYFARKEYTVNSFKWLATPYKAG